MDPAHYQRQADQEHRRLQTHLDKVARADKAIAKEESAAAKDERDVARASSPSTARSKAASAQRHRDAASRARRDRASASDAAAKSQAKIHNYERQARQAEETQRKKATREQQQSNQRERRERDAELRRAAARSLAQTREVTELRERTDQLEEQLRLARLAAPRQICVLFVAGTIEGGREPLRLDREIREIEQKVVASKHRDHVRFEHLHATQVRDIIDGLNRHSPDIVHFSGHGARTMLVFEGPDGRPHELRDDQLALLLQVAAKPIRLLVLNACESAEQASLATDFVDAAIGMETSIHDDTAKVFAGQLYATLAEGLPLATAFMQATAQAVVVNDDDSVRPRLYVNVGIEADEIVLVAPD